MADESVLPRLRGLKVAAIRVEFQDRPPAGDALRKVYGETPGWLQELFPADELMARELGLAPEAVEFRRMEPAGDQPVYRVEARDRAGRVALAETFTPLFEERPFFRRFPSWGAAPVPMAGFVVRRDGREVERVAVPTDMGAVWDVYQAEVIPALEEQIRKAAGGKPTPDKQPFFRRLTAELAASEPDERLGLDEEHVSALEAFHEDFYFLTLEFVNHILEKDAAKEPEGGYFRANPFAAPGNVLPLVTRGPAGKGPVVAFKLELPLTDTPQLVLDYTTLEPVTHTDKVKLEPLKGAVVHCESLYVSADRAVCGARYRVELKTAAEFDAFCRFSPGTASWFAPGRTRSWAGSASRRWSWTCARPMRPASSPWTSRPPPPQRRSPFGEAGPAVPAGPCGGAGGVCRRHAALGGRVGLPRLPGRPVVRGAAGVRRRDSGAERRRDPEPGQAGPAQADAHAHGAAARQRGRLHRLPAPT